VKEALHIPEDYPPWELCTQWDADKGYTYTSLPIGSQWIYESLKGQYRMIHYSGDIDAAVPTTGTINWILSTNPKVLEDWRPYNITIESGPTLAGYIIEYEGLTLGTVHGAGHMAPQFKPQETYHLLFNWLKQTPI